MSDLVEAWIQRHTRECKAQRQGERSGNPSLPSIPGWVSLPQLPGMSAGFTDNTFGVIGPGGFEERTVTCLGCGATYQTRLEAD